MHCKSYNDFSSHGHRELIIACLDNGIIFAMVITALIMLYFYVLSTFPSDVMSQDD